MIAAIFNLFSNKKLILALDCEIKRIQSQVFDKFFVAKGIHNCLQSISTIIDFHQNIFSLFHARKPNTPTENLVK